MKDKDAAAVAETVGRAYREKMIAFSRMSILDIWYDRIDWSTVIDATSDQSLQEHRKGKLKKEKKRTVQDYYFPKLTQQLSGKYVFKDNPPLMYHMPVKNADAYFKRVKEALDLYATSLQEDRQRSSCADTDWKM